MKRRPIMDINERKIKFIRWILSNFQHANPSVNYLLEFLSSHKEYMPNIRFSEAVKYAPRGIYISYQNNSPIPFIYYKDQFSYTFSDQAFHDMRLNNKLAKDDFYFEFNIPNSYKELFLFDVFEENPYIPKDDKAQEDLEIELNNISINARITYLRQELDQALEKHNFEKASYILNEIESLKGEEG